jgi:hypothetical protein
MTMNNAQSDPTTTDAGIPVSSDEHSLTIGPDGPILLQDHYLIEQMANFNRERIAERQPHAKGSGAVGGAPSPSAARLVVPPRGIGRQEPRRAGRRAPSTAVAERELLR